MLGGEPGLEVRVDALGEGDEFGVLVDGEMHEGYEVGEDAFAAGASDLGFLYGGVGVPDLRFIPQVVRLFNGVGE